MRGEGGFTLVEMLVALALLGMAAMMMATGFASGERVWQGVDQRTAAGESIETAQTLIRERIERLRPVTRTEGAAQFADIDGDAGHLDFIALPPDARRPAPMRRYRLSLDRDGELVLASAGAISGWGGDDGPHDQVMLTHVRDMQISYFGPDPTGGQPLWQEDWSSRETPPRLVRVRLSFGPGDRRSWPELIMRPAASVDTLCVILAETGRCRGRE
jgi:general secretion pathway protein J